MDRSRRFKAAAAGSSRADAVDKGRLRRAVLDDARRKVERALARADAAEDLAKAVQTVLMAAEAKPTDVQSMGLAELRTALPRYRQVAGGQLIP